MVIYDSDFEKADKCQVFDEVTDLVELLNQTLSFFCNTDIQKTFENSPLTPVLDEFEEVVEKIFLKFNGSVIFERFEIHGYKAIEEMDYTFFEYEVSGFRRLVVELRPRLSFIQGVIQNYLQSQNCESDGFSDLYSLNYYLSQILSKISGTTPFFTLKDLDFDAKHYKPLVKIEEQKLQMDNDSVSEPEIVEYDPNWFRDSNAKEYLERLFNRQAIGVEYDYNTSKTLKEQLPKKQGGQEFLNAIDFGDRKDKPRKVKIKEGFLAKPKK